MTSHRETAGCPLLSPGSWTLRAKLTAVLVSLSAAALLSIGALFLLVQRSQLRRNQESMLDTVGATIASDIEIALSLEDRTQVEETISVVPRLAEGMEVAVYDGRGELAARAPAAGWRAPRMAPKSGGASVAGENLRVVRGIGYRDLAGRMRRGTLVLQSPLSQIGDRLLDVAMQVLMAFSVLLGLVVLMADRIARTLTAPIHGLASIARRISEERDFGVRVASGSGGPEVRMLSATFNEMLESLEAHDKARVDRTAELQMEVRRRTVDLIGMNERLRAERDRAEAALKARSQFLANISHEMRTPLNAVIGMTDLLLGTRLAPEQREYCMTVQQSASALLQVIEEILDFAKIETGEIALSPAPCDLMVLVDEVLRPAALRAESKGIDLCADLDPRIPREVVLDGARLRQVLTNLVGNAVRFTERGHVAVAVERKGPGRIEFAVEDTGIGIAPDRQEAVFDPFVQEDNSTSRRFGGTGLGLSISRQIVRAMGSDIGIRSAPGAGSRFSFELRVDELPGPEPRASLLGKRALLCIAADRTRRCVARVLRGFGAEVTSADAVEGRRRLLAGEPFDIVVAEEDGEPWEQGERVFLLLKPMQMGDGYARIEAERLGGALAWPVSPLEIERKLAGNRETRKEDRVGAAKPRAANILLAEDNLVNQRLVKTILTRAGYCCDVASDGQECVAAFGRKVYDLLLMDMQMPVVDGVEAASRIRSMEKTTDRRVPILALTANATPEDRERCMAAGMNGFLTKPMRANKLLEAVEKALSGGV
ncbi:MAG: hypothetical protein Fur0037_25560 [Planctomycetota bacterium]